MGRKTKPELDAAPAGGLDRRLQDILGALDAGSRLPPLRRLAARLQVSHVTVGKAMQRLEAGGVVVAGSDRIRYKASPAGDRPERLPQGVVAVISQIARMDPRSPFVFDHHCMLALTRGLMQSEFHPLLLRPPRDAHEAARLSAFRPSAWVALHDAFLRDAPTMDVLSEALGSGTPVVAIGDGIPAADVRKFAGDAVFTDQREGGRLLVRHLVERGRRRLLSVWHDECNPHTSRASWPKERLAGMREAADEAGLRPPDILVLPTIAPLPTLEESFRRVSRAWSGLLRETLTRHRPAYDAVLAPGDGEAYAVTAAARELGRTPDDDLDVTGYDAYWAGVLERLYERQPPRATIDRNGTATGAAVAELVAARLGPGRGEPPARRTVAPTLVVPGDLPDPPLPTPWANEGAVADA